MNNAAKRDKTRSHLRPVVYSPTPSEPPPQARPLSWRSPGTLILAALLAFQIGLVGTLLWTLGRPPPDAPRPLPRSAAGSDLNPAVEHPPAIVAEPAELQAPPPAAAQVPAGAAPAVAAPAPAGAVPAAPAVAAPATSPAPAPAVAAPAPAAAAPAPAAARRPVAPRPTPAPSAAQASPAPTAAQASPAPTAAEPSPALVETPLGLVEVEIRSEPEGAEVHIAGALWGLTPLTALLPPGRPVTIELKLSDYAPARLSWSSSSKSRTLNAVLRPLKDL